MTRTARGPLAGLTQWAAAVTGIVMVAGTVIGGTTNLQLAGEAAPADQFATAPAGEVPVYDAPVAIAPPPLVPQGQVPPLGGAPSLGPILQASATDANVTGAQDSSFTGDAGVSTSPVARPRKETAAQAFERSSYNADIGGAAIGSYAKVPYYAVVGSPYTQGTLRKVAGSPAESESLGAGYWLGVAIEEGILGAGFDPSGGSTLTSYKNPTYARATYPVDKKTNTPTISSTPAGLQWTARCPSGLQAIADGKQVALSAAGVVTAASAISRSVSTMNVRSRTITSIADSSAQEITAGPLTISAFRSWLKVVQTGNGQRPRISYLLSIGGVRNAGAPLADIGDKGFTLSGTNVPVEAFESQFNDQVNAHHAAVAALGDYRFSFLKPVVTFEGIKTDIVSPVLSFGGAIAARTGTIGQEQGVRLGDARFNGYFLTH